MTLTIARGLALTALFVVADAHAALITIEPDDYAPGSMVSTPDATVAFAYHTTGNSFLTYQAALAAVEPTCTVYAQCYAPTGSQVLSEGTLSGGQLQPGTTLDMDNMFYGFPPFGWTPGTKLDATTIAPMHSFKALRVDFAVPTDYFSADFYGTSEPIIIWTFATDGTLLSYTNAASPHRVDLGPGCLGMGCHRFGQTVSIQHATADIGFVLVGAISAFEVPDAVRFNTP